MVPALRATEPPEIDTNGDALDEPFALDLGSRTSLPLQTTEKISLGAVTESPSEATEADKLAKQLANPISSLISVPFQANEDFGYGPSHNGYKFTLNIQPVIPISLTKDWNLILRTIFPIVSQHDLFGTGPSVVIVDKGMARSFTTDTIHSGIYAFTFDQQGLMAGLGLQGSKIMRID